MSKSKRVTFTFPSSQDPDKSVNIDENDTLITAKSKAGLPSDTHVFSTDGAGFFDDRKPLYPLVPDKAKLIASPKFQVAGA